ncbi:5-formyltetrahydrofolate cyclo-ligase [Sphaceloma murrayae]|uniref:5-formyltetrahydrofolate cyclo-ligase n=1 Tax=Sphaceloma murrayae TaxID=2082308 RepID=A0A2K1R141_9PEZI|nr:5-formyltetrahydrofolate cyclo-ligase [Sphaceloma murrayae]
MAPRIPKKPQTEGSFNFDPDQILEKWEKGEIGIPTNNDFRKCILRAFGLRANDTYVYKAIAEVTLEQAQVYLNYGDQGRLLEWYRDEEGNKLPSPPTADITAYTNIFASTTSTPSALRALLSNAKKLSLRHTIATHLLSLHLPHPTLSIPKLKVPHPNPYLDLWTWSCHALHWAGPDPGTADTKISHALLPVLYHHFGCVVPTYEALVVIKGVAEGRPIIDLGSGNGYWTYMLRRLETGPMPSRGKIEVVPVDSGHSTWRTVWVGDTVVADGVEFLGKRDGGKGDVLLLVYPQVGDDFTGRVLRAYKGETVVVAGTQNGNGFTGFKGETIDKWMEREMGELGLVARIPLPSFAGKDEALFVFERNST